MEVTKRGGEYLRVADPSWDEPLDGSYSMRYGGRWNAKGSFPVVYLNANVRTARANARHKLTEQLRGQPVSANDLDPSELPVLVHTEVPDDHFLDVVTEAGVAAAGLPSTYPHDATGAGVPHALGQEVGQKAWITDLPGIACRSAAPHAPRDGEELAWFERDGRLEPSGPAEPFENWYGSFDW